MHIGLIEFVTFALYYVILKAFLQFLNVETRRNGYTIPAAISGILA